MDRYEYVLSLKDQASGSLRRISGTADGTVRTLSALTSKNKELQGASRDLGNSLSTLHRRIDLLQAERELLPATNLKGIRAYNREIDALNRQVGKLDRLGRSGGLRGLFDQLNGLMGGVLSSGPLLAGAAAGASVGKALKFEEGMAKINITAQLGKEGLSTLAAQIKEVTAANRQDVTRAPEAFEKILSQVGDVGMSLKIFDAAQKGAKGGFVDMDTVSAALAQTASIVGASADPLAILDTFFASKRVGAGEFADFARYMPTLIAGGSNLGIGYKDVAGMFAYMTGKGQTAERASVLMENAFSVLGRGEVQKNMAAAGVDVFDENGQMRGIVDIMRDLNAVTSSLNDREKSNLLEKMGLRDKEAKNAFAIFSSDVDKLARSMSEVAASAGETQKAIEFASNPLQRMTELWNSAKAQLVDLGGSLIPVVNAGLWALGGALSIVNPLLSGATSLFGYVFDGLKEGDPLVWGLVTSVGVLTVGIKAATIAGKAHALWISVMNVRTKLLTASTALLNTAMKLTPWGIAAVAVGGLTALFVGLSNRTDKIRKSFADFNIELGRTTDGARDAFTAAMQAAAGSDARAESIRRINEQYGTYLPSLLSEKATNEELETALSRVNDQVERKLRARFYEEALSDAYGGLDKAKKAVYTDLTAMIGDSPEVYSTIGGLLSQMDAGMLSAEGVQGALKNKYGLSDLADMSMRMVLGRYASRLGAFNETKSQAGAMYGMLPVAVRTPEADGTALPGPLRPTDEGAPAGGRSVKLDRFCDSMVIRIDHADGKGYEQIGDEVMRQLMGVFDNYEE